jgi:hypothetical protein
MRNRSGFLVLIIWSCGCGGVQQKATFPYEEVVVDEETESRVVTAIEKLNGKVTRDESKPNKPVVGVNLSSTAVKDADLKGLTQLKALTNLVLANTSVTDAGIRELKSLKALTNLTLFRSGVTEAGVADLKKSLPNCKVVWQ